MKPTIYQKRPTKQQYAMLIAVMAAMRSEDPRTKVGCVFTSFDGHVIATGYNGLPPGIVWSEDLWGNKEAKLKHVIHAEHNAIEQAGENVSHVYAAFCTLLPCLSCASKLANLPSIDKVYYLDSHKEARLVKRIFTSRGIGIIQLPKEELFEIWPEKSILNQLTDYSLACSHQTETGKHLKNSQI